MRLSARDAGSVLVASVDADRIVGGNAAAFLDHLSTLVAGRPCVILDVSSVCYVDFLGFEALLDGLRRCPGRAVLAGMRPELTGLFTLAHLEAAIERCNTVDDALRSFAHSTRTTQDPTDLYSLPKTGDLLYHDR